MTNKLFPHNYVWPGAKAIMYNVQLSSFFYAENSDDYDPYDGTLNTDDYKLLRGEVSGMKDFGFEWRKQGTSTWTSVSLKITDEPTISKLSDINNGSVDMGENYMCQRYISNEESGIYPTRVLIKNLETNTTYDLQTYYINASNVKITIGSQTVTTLENSSNISIDTQNITYTTKAQEHLNDEGVQDYIDRIISVCQDVIEIYKMFTTSFNKTIRLRFDYDDERNWAASGGVSFNLYYHDEGCDGVRSVLVHELGHSDMIEDRAAMYDEEGVVIEVYKKRVIKFMEFATNQPYAIWKWQGYHCFPVLNGHRYEDFTDVCLVVAAFELTNRHYDYGVTE